MSVTTICRDGSLQSDVWINIPRNYFALCPRPRICPSFLEATLTWTDVDRLPDTHTHNRIVATVHDPPLTLFRDVIAGPSTSPSPVTMAVWAVMVVLGLGLAESAKRSSSNYTTRFDSIDVIAVLNNERILKRYIDCALEKGPCTAEGRELKSKYIRMVDTAFSGCGNSVKM